jgi:hypothetical protein
VRLVVLGLAGRGRHLHVKLRNSEIQFMVARWYMCIPFLEGLGMETFGMFNKLLILYGHLVYVL